MNRHTGKIAGPVLVVVLAGLIVGGGCSNTGGATNSQNDVYAAAVALTAADNVALRYVTLPLCGPTHAKPLCSEAAVSAQIKAAAQTAHDAIKAAESGNGTLDAARAAVTALINATPKTGG